MHRQRGRRGAWTWGAGTGYWLRRLCPRGSGEKRWSHPGKRPKLGEKQGVASPGVVLLH